MPARRAEIPGQTRREVIRFSEIKPGKDPMLNNEGERLIRVRVCTPQEQYFRCDDGDVLASILKPFRCGLPVHRLRRTAKSSGFGSPRAGRMPNTLIGHYRGSAGSSVCRNHPQNALPRFLDSCVYVSGNWPPVPIPALKLPISQPPPDFVLVPRAQRSYRLIDF
jgi:hypothetical protein